MQPTAVEEQRQQRIVVVSQPNQNHSGIEQSRLVVARQGPARLRSLDNYWLDWQPLAVVEEEPVPCEAVVGWLVPVRLVRHSKLFH